MKKLTAGIFSALLGIVAVGAADAKIATDGYVTGITGDKADLTGQASGKANLVEAINVKADSSTVGELNTTVQQNVSDISGLTSTVGTHTTALEKLNGANTVDGSVAKALKDAMDYTDLKTTGVATDTVVAGKQDKSTSDYAVGTSDGEWQALTPDQISALNSGVTTDTLTKVGQNTQAIETLNGDATNENSVAGKISAALNAGNFASKTEAQGYATTAQNNAADYTDQKVGALIAEGGAVKVLEGKVNTLEGTVGDASGGLVKSVADNAQAIADLDTTYVTEEELQALDADKTANAGSYISGVKQEDGVITGITETAFDDALSATSTNAVQNKVVDAKFVEVEGSLNGKITAPSTVDETGTLVLTAKYDTATRSYTYQWESITGRE